MADSKLSTGNPNQSSLDPREEPVRTTPLFFYYSCDEFIAVGPPGLAPWQHADNLIKVPRMYFLEEPSLVEGTKLWILTLPRWYADKKGLTHG